VSLFVTCSNYQLHSYNDSFTPNNILSAQCTCGETDFWVTARLKINNKDKKNKLQKVAINNTFPFEAAALLLIFSLY